MKKLQKLTIAILISLSSLIYAPQVSAKTETYGAFYVEPNLPENQYNKNAGYFDLIMEKDMEQTISFDIVNQGNVEMNATINFHDGSTELNAEKSYRQDIKPDASMEHPMTKLATIDKTSVKVAPNSSERIYVSVSAPSEEFDGVSVGGFTITADTEAEVKPKSEGFELDSRLSYLIALQVRMNENAVDKNLNYISSSADSIAKKPQFTSIIQNDKAVVMNDVTIKGTVTSSKGEEVANINKETGGILPNSEFVVAYNLVNDKIEAGDYDIHLKITSEEDSWEWDETVSIAEQVAKDINEQTFKEKNTSYIWIILIFIILILLILIIILLRKLRNRER